MIIDGVKLNRKKIPRHIAIIMDGNGRWARQHNKPIQEGHRAGMRSIRRALNACEALGSVKYLSIYAFSTENWQRPADEVSFLMKLVKYFYNRHIKTLMQKEVRVVHSGILDELPTETQKYINRIVSKTKNNKKIVLNVCLNYSGKMEILYAINSIIKEGKGSVDEDTLRRHFFQPDIPDVDLMIRTSGEMRISNFCLWQLAYSELYFCDVLWPDFSERDLYMAVADYQRRKRRFGKREEVD